MKELRRLISENRLNKAEMNQISRLKKVGNIRRGNIKDTPGSPAKRAEDICFER